MNEERLKKLWSNLPSVEPTFNITYDEFSKDMDDPDKRHRLYESLRTRTANSENKFTLSDIDADNDLGYSTQPDNLNTLQLFGDAASGITGIASNKKESMNTAQQENLHPDTRIPEFDKADWADSKEQLEQYRRYSELNKKYANGNPNEQFPDLIGFDTPKETDTDLPVLSIPKENTKQEYEELESLKQTLPSYMLDNEETLSDVRKNMEDYWTTKTTAGRAAKKLYDDKVNELQREFMASPSYIDGAEELNQELFVKQYAEQLENIQKEFNEAIYDANKGYAEDYKRRVGRKVSDKTLSNIEKDIRNQMLEEGKKHNNADDNLALGYSMLYNHTGQDHFSPEMETLNAAYKFAGDARKTIEAVKEGKGFWKGMGEGLANQDTWDLGMGELSRNAKLKQVVEKYESGGEDKLTSQEKSLLDAATTYMAVTSYYSDKLGRWYKAGLSTAQSVPFMLEIMATPLEGISNGIVKSLMKRASKHLAGHNTRTKLFRAGAQALVGYPAAAATQTMLWSAPKVAAGAVDRMMGDIAPDFSEDGKSIVYGGIQEGSEQNAAQAIYNSFMDQTIENYSELAFGALTPIGRLMKKSELLRAFANSRPATAYTNFWKRPVMRELHDKVKFRGLLGEFGEEELGSALRYLLTPADVQDYVLDENGNPQKDDNGNYITKRSLSKAGFNADDQIDTILGLLPMSVAFSSAGVASTFYNQAKTTINSVRFQKALEDNELKNMFRMTMKESNTGKFYEAAHDAIRAIVNNSELSTDMKMSGINAIVGRYSELVSNELDDRQRRLDDKVFARKIDDILSTVKYQGKDANDKKFISVVDNEQNQGFVVGGNMAFDTDSEGHQVINAEKSDKTVNVVFSRDDGTFTKPFAVDVSTLNRVASVASEKDMREELYAEHYAKLLGYDTYKRNGRVFSTKTGEYLGTEREVKAVQEMIAEVDAEHERELLNNALTGSNEKKQEKVSKPKKVTLTKDGKKVDFTFTAASLALNEDGTVDRKNTVGLFIKEGDKVITKSNADYDKYVEAISDAYVRETMRRKKKEEKAKAKLDEEQAAQKKAAEKAAADKQQQQNAEQQLNALVGETLKDAKYDEDGVLDRRATEDQRVADDVRRLGADAAKQKSTQQLAYLHGKLAEAQADTKKSPDDKESEILRYTNRIAKREAAIIKFFGQEALDAMNKPAEVVGEQVVEQPATTTTITPEPAQSPAQAQEQTAAAKEPQAEVGSQPQGETKDKQDTGDGEQPAMDYTSDEYIVVKDGREVKSLVKVLKDEEGNVTGYEFVASSDGNQRKNIASIDGKLPRNYHQLGKRIVYGPDGMKYVALTTNDLSKLYRDSEMNVIRADGKGGIEKMKPSNLYTDETLSKQLYTPNKSASVLAQEKAATLNSIDELLDIPVVTYVNNDNNRVVITLRDILFTGVNRITRTVNEKIKTKNGSTKVKETEKRNNLTPYEQTKARIADTIRSEEEKDIVIDDLKRGIDNAIKVWNAYFGREDVKVNQSALAKDRYKAMAEEAGMTKPFIMPIDAGGKLYEATNYKNPIYQMMVMIDALRSNPAENIESGITFPDSKNLYTKTKEERERKATKTKLNSMSIDELVKWHLEIEQKAEDENNEEYFIDSDIYDAIRNRLASNAELLENTKKAVEGSDKYSDEEKDYLSGIISEAEEYKKRREHDISLDHLTDSVEKDRKVVNRDACEYILSLLERVGVKVHMLTREQLDETVRRKTHYKSYAEFKLSSKDNESFGYMEDGEIYLNPYAMNANTPIHEFTHLWFAALEQSNPEEIKRIVRVLKRDGKFMWDKVLADKLYKNIHGDDVRMASEVLSRLTGSYFGRIDSDGKSVLQRMLESRDIEEKLRAQSLLGAIRRFWNKVLSLFGMEFKSYKTDEFDGELQEILNMPINSIITQQYLQVENEGEEYQIVTDPKLLDFLENQEQITVYRAMVLNDDGTIGGPMSSKGIGKTNPNIKSSNKAGSIKDAVKTEPDVFGRYVQSEENKGIINRIVEGHGMVTIHDDAGGSTEVAYNPYNHVSLQMLNDQFAKAWRRPNMVIVECVIPKSELTSGYKAELAKNAVGPTTEWNKGPVSKHFQKGKERVVILTRYVKPIKPVPMDEFAQSVKKQLEDNGILEDGIPFNVVTPQQREALVKAGVPIVEPTKGSAGDKARPVYEAWKKGSDAEFQIIGAKGARALDEMEEATYRIDNLHVAQKMEKAGKDANFIHAFTGWERGADRKWRYEIYDVKLRKDFIELAKSRTGEQWYFLGDVVKGPSDGHGVLNAYSLDTLGVVIDEEMQDDEYGFYDDNEYTIHINRKLLYNEDELLKTLVHELQHVVQYLEGFSNGTSPESLDAGEYAYATSNDDITKLMRNTIDEYLDAKRYIEKYGNIKSHLNSFEPFLKLPKRVRDIVKTAFKAEKIYSESAIQYINGIIIHLRKDIITRNKKAAEYYYIHKAGEVEARNASNRIDLDILQRLSIALSETEDVLRSEQLFESDEISEKDIKYFTSVSDDAEDILRRISDVLDNSNATPEFQIEETVFTSEKASRAIVDTLTKAGIRTNIISENELQDYIEEGGLSEIKDNNGIVCGFTKDNEIYLVQERMNPITPVHEYTHLWVSAFAMSNKQEWGKYVDILKHTDMWKSIANNENYKDIWGDDFEMASEVFARLTAARYGAINNTEGKSYFEQVQNGEATEDRSVIDTLRDIWYKILDWFGLYLPAIKNTEYFDRLEQNYISGIINKPVNDLLNTSKIIEDIKSDAARDAYSRLMATYHGTTADFDAFDFSFMGTGEGLQAYGWGGYVSQVEKVAISYAEQGKYKIEFLFEGQKYDVESLVKKLETMYYTEGNIDYWLYTSLFEAARDNSSFEEIANDTNMKVANCYSVRNFLIDKNPDYFTEDNEELSEKLSDLGLSIAEIADRLFGRDLRCATIDKIDNTITRCKFRVKALQILIDAGVSMTNYKQCIVYEVDIPDDTGDNYLSWDEVVTDSMRMRISENISRFLESDESRQLQIEHGILHQGENGEYFYGRGRGAFILFPDSLRANSESTGWRIYTQLQKLFGTDKATSRFLHDKCGIVGNKVSVGYHKSGKVRDAKNYIIFDESDMHIKKKSRFDIENAQPEYQIEESSVESEGNLSEDFARPNKNSTFATISPFFDKNTPTQESVDNARALWGNTEYVRRARKLADILGLKIVSVNEGRGGYDFEDGTHVDEPSTTWYFDKDADQNSIQLFSHLLGDLGTNQQEGVINAKYIGFNSKKFSCYEITIYCKDTDKAITDLRTAGISDYTIDAGTNAIRVLEFNGNYDGFDEETDKEKIKELEKVSIEKLKIIRSHLIESNNYDESRETEICNLQSNYASAEDRKTFYRSWIQSEISRQDGTKLRPYVELAYQRVTDYINGHRHSETEEHPELDENLQLTDYGRQVMEHNKNNIEFQIEYDNERERIESEAKANNTWLLAPNGLPSKLGERAWVEVRTTAFKNWFGDWENDPENSSKVIDAETGEPMIVYHGTRYAGFDEFNLNGSRSQGIYATDNVYASNVYAGNRKNVRQKAQEAELNAPEHSGIYPLFVNLRNPMVVDFSDENGNPRFWDRYGEPKYAVLLDAYEDNNMPAPTFDSKEDAIAFAKENGEGEYAVIESFKTTDDFLPEAKDNGNDGCIFLNVMDGTEGLPEDLQGMNDYVALEPQQVKSATKNNGDYNPEDLRIEYQIVSADPSDIDLSVRAYEQALSDVAAATMVDMTKKEPEAMGNFSRAIYKALDRTEGVRRLQEKINIYRKAKGKPRIDSEHDVRSLLERVESKIEARYNDYNAKEKKNRTEVIRKLAEVVSRSKFYQEHKLEQWKSAKEKELHTLTEVEFIERYLIAMDNLDRIKYGIEPRGVKEFRYRMGVSMGEFAEEFYHAYDKELIEELWKSIRACTDKSLDALLEGKMISQEDYEEYKRRDFYVPERDFAEIEYTPEENIESNRSGGKGKRTIKSQATMYHAEGADSLAANVLANIDVNALDAIEKAERNKVKIAMYELLTDNEDWCNEFGWMMPGRVWYRINVDGKYEVSYDAPTLEEEAKRDEIKQLIKEVDTAIAAINGSLISEKDVNTITDLNALKEESIQYKKSLISQLPYLDSREIRGIHRDSMQELNETVPFFINGETYAMKFVNQVQIAEALNNITFQRSDGPVAKIFKTINRVLSGMCTTYNPAFFAVNLVRDFAFMTAKGTVEYGFDFSPRVLVEMFKRKSTLKVIHDYLSGKLDENSKYGKVFKQFLNEGGPTGYAFMPDMEKLKKDVANWKDKGDGISIEDFLHTISIPTEFSELWTRFSAYKVLLDMGYSETQALNAAKNLSVNFDRRGFGNNIWYALSTLSMFANAAIQGASGFYRSFYTEGTKEQKIHKAIRAFNVMCAVPAIAGFISTLLSPDDDDEEYRPSAWDRDNYAVFGNYRLPINEQLKPFWVVGVNVALGIQGKRNANEIANSIINSVIRGLLPMPTQFVNLLVATNDAAFGTKEYGPAHLIRDLFTPSSMQTISQIAEDRNFLGGKLTSNSTEIPEYLMGDTEAILYRDIAKAFYDMSGGNKAFPDRKKFVTDNYGHTEAVDVWNINPKEVKAALSIAPSFFVNALELAYGGVRSAWKDVDFLNDAVSAKNVPIMNRFYRGEDNQRRLFRLGVSREARDINNRWRETKNHAEKGVQAGNKAAVDNYIVALENYPYEIDAVLDAYDRISVYHMAKQYGMTENQMKKSELFKNLPYDSIEEEEIRLTHILLDYIYKYKGQEVMNEFPKWMEGKLPKPVERWSKDRANVVVRKEK